MGAAWWLLCFDSCRVTQLHVARNLKALSRDGTTPLLPHMRYSVRNINWDDLTDETLRSPQRPEEIDGETW